MQGTITIRLIDDRRVQKENQKESLATELIVSANLRQTPKGPLSPAPSSNRVLGPNVIHVTN
jgi:hypothetical protein